jgi:hypothetical protein
MSLSDYLVGGLGGGALLESDFFSGGEKKLHGPEILETEWAPQMRAFLTELMTRQPNMPLQSVAGMTDTEQAGQSMLAKLLSGGMFEDPRESDYYKGFRAENEMEEEGALSRLKRLSQRGGMGVMPGVGPSTGLATGAGKTMARYSGQRLSLLGGLYNQERERDNPYTRLQAVSQYGGLPREIQNQQGQALYNQQYGNMMFPYQNQAPIAQNLLNYQPWHQPQYAQTPSMFSKIMQTGAAIAPYVAAPFTGGASLALAR